MPGLGQWLDQGNLTMLGFQVLSNRSFSIYFCLSLSLSHLHLPLNALHSLLVLFTGERTLNIYVDTCNKCKTFSSKRMCEESL